MLGFLYAPARWRGTQASLEGLLETAAVATSRKLAEIGDHRIIQCNDLFCGQNQMQASARRSVGTRPGSRLGSLKV